MRKPLAVGVLVTFAISIANAQDSKAKTPAETPLIKTDVRQVVVPVVVFDHKHHYARGLTASDFSVFEDGQQQKIVAFQGTGAPDGVASNSRLAINSAAPTTVAVTPNVSPRRTYLICVDSLHCAVGNLTGARKALVKFFQREHDEEAQYVLISLGRDVQVIQDSTRDPAAILAALESKKFLSTVQNSEASSIAFDVERLRRMLVTVSGVGCQHTSDNCEGVKMQVRSIINSSAERTAVLTRGFLNGLRAIVETTAQMPTDKTLILISDGFNLIPGRELSGVAAAHFLDGSEWLSNQRDTQSYLNNLLRIAQRSNIVFDSLNSRGLYSLASSGSTYDAASSGQGSMQMGEAQNKMDTYDAGISWENESAMAQLAEATGGTYFHNNNDLGAGLRKAFGDSRERYVLAYSPVKAKPDNKFRKIKVVMKDQSLRVNAKTGYWAMAK